VPLGGQQDSRAPRSTSGREDDWVVRRPGLVFSREETTSSVWLMKLQ